MLLISSVEAQATPALPGVDVYDTSTQQLTVPHLTVGNATFVNLVAVIGKIVTPPTGAHFPSADIYDPANEQLNIAVVDVGSLAYYHALVQIAEIVSIGAVEGAATYDGANLTLPAVQVLGGSVYTKVVLAVGISNVVGVGGGLPTVSQVEYNPATQRLLIPVAGYHGKFYTNVSVAVTSAMIKSIGGAQINDTILHAFGLAPDGAFSSSGLIQASDGNLYGTTSSGGAYGTGTVFRISTGGVYTSLYSFGLSGADGLHPAAALVQAGDGNLYGSTIGGGANAYGCLFKITPAGSESVLYSFTETDAGFGGYPNAMTIGSDGNLYGTILFGGVLAQGIIFRITLAGDYSVLYAFNPTGLGGSGYSDGYFPNALTLGGDGNLYGTAALGGANNQGTVFRITNTGTYTQLYSFGVSPDGNSPNSLTRGNDGNLYGTTEYGGSFNGGTVFRFTSTDVETVVYSFRGDTPQLSSGTFIGTGSVDAGIPFNGVIQGSDGNLYGTTNFGGAYNQGTVFKVTTAGVETVIHSFADGTVLTGSPDGTSPSAIVQATDGNLYGTTTIGGTNDVGGIFRLQ